MTETRWFKLWTSNPALPLIEATCHPETHFTLGTVSWYCTIPGFGCSKNYPTPHAAFTEMLKDHMVAVRVYREINRAGNYLT